MNTEINIKNFRTFNEEGVTFNLAPITILTGCNSSGKSSMVKSLLLLNNFFSQMKRDMKLYGDCKPQEYRLGVADSKFRLGNFSSVLNREAKDNKISFSYKVKPLIASEPFTVTYTFVSNKEAALNDGWLYSIEINNNHEETICKISTVRDEHQLPELMLDYFKWSLFKDSFAQFALCVLVNKLTDEIEFDHLNLLKKSCSEIEQYKHYLSEIYRKGLINQISNENIRDFNDVYANDTEIIRELFQSVNLQDAIKIISFFEGNRLLYHMPIFEIVKGVAKENIRKILQDNVNLWNANLDAIITDFEHSTFSTLEEYMLNILDGQNEANLRGRTLLTRINEYIFSIFLKSINKESESIYDTLSTYSKGLETPKNSISDQSDDYFCLFGLYLGYVKLLLKDLVIPSSLDNLVYIGSSKADIQRLYRIDSSGTNSFERTIVDYLESKQQAGNEEQQWNSTGEISCQPGSFVNKWIRNFNIGYAITVKNTAEGLGILVNLHTSTDDKIGHPLADEGYGITQLVSILLSIETAILNAKKREYFTCDGHLQGYRSRIHQSYYAPSYIAIEEPEMHLHPKYQSLLMDMFNDAYKRYNIHFIIETHSEYLVRRSQVLVAEAKYKDESELDQKCPYKVYYLPTPQEGQPYDLEYLPTGGFKRAFGEGFFDEAGKMDMIVLRNESSLRRK